MKKVLIVIDMLNGFCDEKGALFIGPEVRKIIPFVASKVQETCNEGGKALFVCDNHRVDDPEFAQWPPHCVAGSWESKVIPEIPVDKESSVIIPKTTLSLFYNTNLEETLKESQPEVVEVVGVCTNICVLYGVFELRIRQYSLIAYREGTATFDKDAHDFALKEMGKVLGAKVI